MAPRSKISKKKCQIMLEGRMSGLNKQRCAKLAGVHPNTLDNWLKKGKNAKSGIARQFYLDWQEADVKFEIKELERIMDSKDWRAHQFVLWANYGERYIMPSRAESKVEADVKAEVKLSNLFDDDKMKKILEDDDE